MPKFLNTSGYSHVGIATCARCKRKRPYDCLGPDGNSPGLRVCIDGEGCWDSIDPYRLPPLTPDNITLSQPRPDVDVTPDSVWLMEDGQSAWMMQDGLGAWVIG